MATSSISTSFNITKKASAKAFVSALSASSNESKKTDVSPKVVLVSKDEAIRLLKKKNIG